MTGTGADGGAGGRGPPEGTPGDAPVNDTITPPASAPAAPAAPAQATPAAPSNPALATQSVAQAQAVLQQQAAMQAAMAPALQAAMANPAAMAAMFAGNSVMLQTMQAMQAVQTAQGAAAFAGTPAGFPMPQTSATFPAAAAAKTAVAPAAAAVAAPTGASAPFAAKAEPEPTKAEKTEPKTEAPAEAPGRDEAEPEKASAAAAASKKRDPGRPKGSKSSKAASSRKGTATSAEEGDVVAAATAVGVDPETAAEIPPEVLAEALGVQPAGRRSGRKTKARVVMIDGEPVLRSNAYTMNEGEPSVFDKELGEAPDEDGDEANRTSYNFEPAKRKYNKSGKPRKPYVKRQKTEEEAATGKHNREISAAIEAAQSKRAYYLSRHAKALAPFVEAKVMDKIKAQADAHVPSEKILAPIDNQPESIKAVLREYQLEGIRWMTRMFDDGCSCILADEMGLGKTLQSISFLACLHEMRGAKGPHLVICPLSVLSSWMDELQKWCPTFKVVRLHSTDENERQRLRKEVVMNVGSYDVAVTTYEMACNPTFNLTLSQKVYWRTMILDEGHKVKNEDTAAHAVLSRVHRQHTVLLTGTPVQNNMHELYAILAFLHPDVFTSARSFDDAFDLSAQEHRVDSKTLDHAHYLMKPFVLRRVKGEVEVSLPEKTETKIMCPLSPAQTFWYRRLLQRESSALTAVESAELKKHSGGGGGGDEKNASEQSASQNAGDARKLQSLLMQLRKCCNHPYLFAGTDVPEEGVPVDELVEASGKLAVLDRMLSRLKDAGHRVVLFSQFTSMLDILQDYLSLKGYGYARLDGSTNRVQRSIDIAAFNRPNSPMFAFLLSTRAGGLGVNLQTADTCVLFDSDWNPQVDTQAMARVHRIGQKKPVHVYRLVTAGTVEERMQQRAEKKLFLEQMVSRGSTKQSESLEGVDKRDLYSLLRFGVDAIFANDEGKAPTDEELDILMDRTPAGNERRSALASLQSEVQHTVADFADGKASAAPISTYVMPAQIAGAGEKGKKPVSVKDIAAEFSAQILSGKRERRKTTVQIDGHTVLKANNYSLEEGESSVFARETKRKKNETKKPRAQVAGRDYGHSYTCQVCWDGGDIVCCDLCPVSVHAECIGMTQAEIAKATRWGCPHHSCAECGRKSAAVGGMLFRCESCPRAFCEDHLPADAEIIGECKRFQALGQKHPAQACFIRCDEDCRKWAREKRLEEGGDEAEEAQGWTMGAKVALTDAWIEERDHEIELPCDPAGGRVKPLAHATFTDLVHFLLRVEGPKRKDGQSAQRAAAARRKKEAAAAAMGGGWRDELEAADPKPGEEITVRGARAYYTKGWEKLDEVAKRFAVDPKAVYAWNKPDLPSLTQKAFLIENTRLWLTEPPPEEDADSPAPPLDPMAERRREEEELAAAAAAAQRAGIAAAKSRVAGAGAGGDNDDFRDEPTVLGRPLKGLRQKDIDPTEREAIMTEMFKRARPFLERNIEKAKQKEVERQKEDKREDEERRKAEAVRAERLLRRTEGIPVHLLSATASDFRSSESRDVSLGRAPIGHAPHGGALGEETMLEMQAATLRALKRCGAVAPNGEWISAADVKVRVARAERPAAVTHLRTRWDHPELGEAIGFVLAVCALHRSEKVVLQRHEKFPEAVDLAAMRLAENVEVPEASDSGEGDAAEKSDVDAPERGVLPAATVRVQCGEMVGRLTPGGKRGEESVAYTPDEGAPEKVIPATEFERLGGRGSTRKWRQSLRHLDERGEAVTTVGRWLKERGGRWRDAVVGRAMEIRAAAEGQEKDDFSAVEITGFKPESGEHEVMYRDGAREWLYLFLQTTRWPDGVPEDLPPPSSGTDGGDDGDNARQGGKSGSKSGAGKSGGRGRFDPAQMARPEAPEPTVASGPPPGVRVAEHGRLAYYCAEGESADSLAACLKMDFRDVLAWNRAHLPGLTRHAELKPDTGVWIQEGASAAPPAARGEGGGLVETPGARARKEMAAPTPQTVVGGAKLPTAASIPDVPLTEDALGEGEKRKAEDDPEAPDVDAPQPKKRKKKPKPGAKPKPPEIPEEDVAAEVAATCVIRAAEVPVYVGELRGTFAPGSVSGDEAIMVEVASEDAPNAGTEPAPPAPDARSAEAPESAPGPAPGSARTGDARDGVAATEKNEEARPPSAPPTSPSRVAIPVAVFLERAGCSSAGIADWRRTLLFGGDDAGGEGQPFRGWAKRRGASWGKQCVGNKLEILRPDSARTLRVSKDAVHASGSTCSWRPGEVVSFDPETGEHGVAFLDGSEVSCFLFLQTMRWLLDAFEPVTCVPEVPANGGIAIAMPPVPVACGGMRGCLLPGGKRGEELVRYAAPRAAATPGVLAEYVVPATEFERLGGKGTAKKWRQSLRLVAPGTHRQAETMGKWFRAYGSQTGDSSVGRHVEIFWPGDAAFYGGVIAAYKTETGEHELFYDDGGKETLQLSMQTVRWGPPPGPGARARVEKEAAAYALANPPGSKSKKKGGGGGGQGRAPAAANASDAGTAAGAGGVGETDEWIACDACGKWRVVPKTVVAALGDNDRWECKQNPRAAFNSCDIPEEAWEGDGK